MPPNASASNQFHFREPVVLLRSPYRLTFAYAGDDLGVRSAGPGALATILLAAGEVRAKPLLFAGFLGVVALVIIVCWILMLATPRLINVLGVTGANVVSRLSGVILAALAVQFIVDGIRGSFLPPLGMPLGVG